MSRSSKKFLTIVAVCSAGVLFQAGLFSTSCAQFYGQALLTSLDFCSVFNCTSGTFSNLCEPIPLFVDCPNYTEAQP